MAHLLKQGPFFEKKWAFMLFTIILCLVINISNGQKIKAGKDKFNKQARAGKQADHSYIVPTLQIVDPVGDIVNFPGRPVDIAINPAETTLAVKNVNTIVFISTADKAIK